MKGTPRTKKHAALPLGLPASSGRSATPSVAVAVRSRSERRRCGRGTRCRARAQIKYYAANRLHALQGMCVWTCVNTGCSRTKTPFQSFKNQTEPHGMAAAGGPWEAGTRKKPARSGWWAAGGEGL